MKLVRAQVSARFVLLRFNFDPTLVGSSEDMKMLPLPVSAVLFAMLWTAGMIWWDDALGSAKVVVWAGVGLLWYFAMRKYVHWTESRRGSKSVVADFQGGCFQCHVRAPLSPGPPGVPASR